MEIVKKFGNGLRLVMRKLSGVYSVSTGIYAGVGSSDETKEINGISHFIEHMMFKGTQKRSAFQIADDIDSIGAQINAFTTKEMTCYYTKSTYDHFEQTLEILSDLVFNSVYDEGEIEKEKGVILEEISMVEDTPDELCTDLLAEAYFADTPYARPILGSSDNVKSFTRQNLLDYTEKYYNPQNMVISISGYLDFDKTVELVEKYVVKQFDNKKFSPQRVGEIKPKIKFCHKIKETEQANICVAFPSVKFEHPDMNELTLLNNIFGGGMSSRLFQNIREKQGLAYSVYSYINTYRNNGVLTVYAGINPKNTESYLKSVREIIEEFSNKGVTEQEFERGREQLKSSLVFGQENTSTLMNAYGKYMLMTEKLLCIEDKINLIKNLDYQKANKLCKNLFDFSSVCAAYVGVKDHHENIMNILTK